MPSRPGCAQAAGRHRWWASVRRSPHQRHRAARSRRRGRSPSGHLQSGGAARPDIFSRRGSTYELLNLHVRRGAAGSVGVGSFGPPAAARGAVLVFGRLSSCDEARSTGTCPRAGAAAAVPADASSSAVSKEVSRASTLIGSPARRERIGARSLAPRRGDGRPVSRCHRARRIQAHWTASLSSNARVISESTAERQARGRARPADLQTARR